VFIWQGLGFLVVVIFFAVSIIVERLVGPPYADNPIFVGASLTLTAIIVYLWQQWLAKRPKQQPRQLVDAKTGQAVVIKPRHSLFFVSIQWWPYILGVLALATAIAQFIKQ
jgi:L-lactate permease